MLGNMKRSITHIPEGRQDFVLFLLLGLLLTFELFAIQEYVLKTFHFMTGRRLFEYVGTRFLLDGFFCFTLISFLPKKLLYLIYIPQILIYAAVVTYSDYFGNPPHLTTALYQAGEGVSVLEYALKLAGTTTFIFLALGLITKISITSKCKIMSHSAVKSSIFFYLPIVFYIGSLLVLGLYIKPLNATSETWSIDELMHGYGFSVPWAAEAAFVDQDVLLDAALRESKIEDKRLESDSLMLTLPNKVFVLQTESLDFDILRKSINGKEVTPNLNNILSKSRVYKVMALHFSGSSDSDFVMLTGKRPNKIVAPYKVYSYPYIATLLDAAKQAGYSTQSYHGNTGFFYERRNAFTTMGFDKILFRKELVDLGWKPYADWILDGDLLRQVAIDSNLNTDKELYFVITVTSHGPFSFLPKSEQDNFIKNANNLREQYLNSIHYVDRVLGEFIKDIPKDSLLILYGDHESGTGQKSKDKYGHRVEYVPAIVYYKNPHRLPVSGALRSNFVARSDENLFLSDFANMIKTVFLNSNITRSTGQTH